MDSVNNPCENYYGYNYEEVCQSSNLNSFICDGSLNTYLNLTSFWESMVCPHEKFFEWHARDYLLGECENYGINNLPIYPIGEDALSNFPIS
jgi:hypothetical protein